MPQNSTNLIWIDLEMTGLDPEKDTIIEIATLVTDVNLNVVEEGPVLAIHQSDEVLAAMDKWNTRQHGKSGLTERVRRSHINLKMAEQSTLAFLRQHVPPNTSPMCGNTVSQDRRFLKELAKRWKPKLPKIKKESKHLAISDIYESIEELKYYRQHFLRLS